MANYRAVSTGVWSALARWQDDSSGSYVASTVLPGPSDVVYANNFTVTLDIDVVVLELRNNSATSVNNGGVFNYGAGNSVSANIFAGNTVCLQNNTGTTKTLNGNVLGGGGQQCVYNVGGSTLNIFGNITGGSGGYGVRNDGVLNITGNVVGGINSWGVYHIVGSTIITGNVNAGGNVGLYVQNHSNIIVNGIATASNTQVAINTTTFSGTFRVDAAVANDSQPAINTNATSPVIVKTLVCASNGRFPVNGSFRMDNTATKSIQVVLENNSTLTLVDPATTDIPIEANVRDGVSYASGALTGTLVVPSASTVSLGVVYDNGTVGTAANTAAAFLAELSSSSDPLAIRLQNVSTVDSTAATIAAFKV